MSAHKATTQTKAAETLATARRVLRLEADGVSALAASLDDDFVAAVDLIEAASGRVIITGMGKSGHVARKIAATLASTGQPAYFVHPGEASHGDLGMITPDDPVIALSNSGETTELADLIAYCVRFDIPLIGMTGRRPSALADAATVALVLPDQVKEACPLGLAPTTSTTAMLALGDALAVALLERKGFSPDDFHVFHPGGKLGNQLLKVADIMHTGDALPLMSAAAPMSDVVIEISSKSFGCAGIIDGDGALMGVITDGDLRRHMGDQLLAQSAGAIMTAGAKTVRSGALASEALRLMNAGAITTLFVVDDGKPVGIVHIHDCLRSGVA